MISLDSLKPHSPVLTGRQVALLRALVRAADERLVAFKTDNPAVYGTATIEGGRWLDGGYTVAFSGTESPRTHLVCDCPTSLRGRVCKHEAVTALAVRHGMFATPPVLDLGIAHADQPEPETQPSSAPTLAPKSADARPTCGMSLADFLHEAFCDR